MAPTCGRCDASTCAPGQPASAGTARGASSAGLAAIGVALLSPIEAYEGALFSVHMVQHMLLQLVAAPLLLPGDRSPWRCAPRARPVRRGLLSILQSRIVHVISFPLVAWLLFAATNWGWHFSTLYDDALESTALHYLQHATLLAIGAPLLVAGHRRRSVAVAAAIPGAAVLPLPGHATELVPRHRDHGGAARPLPALRHQPAHLGPLAARRSEASVA